MKNNKPTHCQEEIIKQGKVVCGLESTEELLEEEVVCTTSMKHEEPNKWSHDQNERMKRRSTKPEAKKLLLMIKETVFRWQMTC